MHLLYHLIILKECHSKKTNNYYFNQQDSIVSYSLMVYHYYHQLFLLPQIRISQNCLSSSCYINQNQIDQNQYKDYIIYCYLKHNNFVAMSMNKNDQRLYHYEYRRPRYNNPTYNSSHVHNSINMFVRLDMPTPLMRSYGRYSQPKNQSSFSNNQSQVMNSRYAMSNNNFSTILPPIQAPQHNLHLHDKEYTYLKSLQQKNKQMKLSKIINQNSNSFQEGRLSRTLDYNINRDRSYNPEHELQQEYKYQDSLTPQIKKYQSMKI